MLLALEPAGHKLHAECLKKKKKTVPSTLEVRCNVLILPHTHHYSLVMRSDVVRGAGENYMEINTASQIQLGLGTCGSALFSRMCLDMPLGDLVQ